MINNIAEFAINNMPFPMWIKDLNKKFIFVNKEFKKIYKHNTDEELRVEEHICANCKIKYICSNKIDEVIKSKEKQSFEVKINDVISQCYMSPYFDDKNKLLGVMAILIDITDSKEKQQKIEDRENILRTIIDTLPDYIFYKDKDCNYVGYNKKWKEHYENLGIESMIGKNDIEVKAVSEEIARNFMQEDKAIMKSKKIKITERRMINAKGKEIIEETKKVPVICENGEVWGIVGLSSDVTERIELKEKLMKLSYTDTLTDVYNRACFEDKIVELNKNSKLPIGVIMGDVNGLKVVNDTFGHLEGDRLLKEMANVLKSVSSKKDFIFRWGGDEFVILMPNCDEKKCESIISTIKKECKESEFGLIDMSISLGASIKYDLRGSIYENLKEAEEKLYRQKFLNEKSIRSSIILSLSQSLHEKNVETEQHTRRLVKYALRIGEVLGFTTAQLDELELVTKLHDIGKIGVSEDILLKKTKLTAEEFEEIKTHSEKGYRILYASRELAHISRNILTHHERYDGKGYPLGLSGEEIPIMARIVNIVDSYDAMTTDRGYNKVKNIEEAMEEIKDCSGTQFDPKIAEIFIKILKEKV